jgi:hypothetical protein
LSPDLARQSHMILVPSIAAHWPIITLTSNLSDGVTKSSLEKSRSEFRDMSRNYESGRASKIELIPTFTRAN